MFFLRKAKQQEPLALTMSGVRMGERALQIGIDDPSLAATIAAKVGLSGHAAIAVADEAAAAKARAATAKAGALVDVHVAPLSALPLADGSFDVVVVHAASDWLGSLEDAARVAVLSEGRRVLRVGGRLVLIESASRASVALEALGAAGFRPARLLAEREGVRFSEGLKMGSDPGDGS